MQLLQQPGRENIPNRTLYYHQLRKPVAAPGHRVRELLRPLIPYEFKEPVSVTSSRDAPVQAITDYVGTGFFQMIGMRLLAGREFDWRDNENAPRCSIISLSRRLFPSGDPIGTKIVGGSQLDHKTMEIVGVVNSASGRSRSARPQCPPVPRILWLSHYGRRSCLDHIFGRASRGCGNLFRLSASETCRAPGTDDRASY